MQFAPVGPESASDAGSVARSPLTRGHSCLRCQRRKIKCNGQTPCASCVKGGHGCERSDRNINQTRHQHRVSKGTNSRDQSNAIRRDAITPLSILASPPERPILPATNNELNSSIIESGKEQTDLAQVESILFHPQTSEKPEAVFWPSPIRSFQLWQVYTENVNPITNLLHLPTTQRLVLEASDSKWHELPPRSAAILSAIYLAATESLHEKECTRIADESRSALLRKLFATTQKSLVRADLMANSSYALLQAFVLYLLAARQHSLPPSLWLVIGVAVRCAQRLGIHRESKLQAMTVFEGEMCRRLWWQIHLLNRHYTNICEGVDSADLAYTTPFDTRKPLNLNDADLHPDMTVLPTERQGTTEMMFCSVRYKIGDFTRQLSAMNGDSQRKLEAIQNLQQDLEEQFAKSCDGSIPIQRVTRCLIKTTVSRLTLMHCCSSSAAEAKTLEDKSRIFNTALLLLQTQNSSCANKMLERYRWHTKLFYCFEALYPVLRALAFDDLDDSTSTEAWKQVTLAYEYNPELLNDSASDFYRQLYNSLAPLAFKAWRRRSELESRAISAPPAFIQRLLSQQEAPANVIAPSSEATIPQEAGNAGVADHDLALDEEQMDLALDLGNLEDGTQSWEHWLSLLENDDFLGF